MKIECERRTERGKIPFRIPTQGKIETALKIAVSVLAWGKIAFGGQYGKNYKSNITASFSGIFRVFLLFFYINLIKTITYRDILQIKIHKLLFFIYLLYFFYLLK